MGEISEKEGKMANGQVPGEAEKCAVASIYQDSLLIYWEIPVPFDIF